MALVLSKPRSAHDLGQQSTEDVLILLRANGVCHVQCCGSTSVVPAVLECSVRMRVSTLAEPRPEAHSRHSDF